MHLKAGLDILSLINAYSKWTQFNFTFQFTVLNTNLHILCGLEKQIPNYTIRLAFSYHIVKKGNFL